MECRLVLDIVILEGSAILELMAAEEQAWLCSRPCFFYLVHTESRVHSESGGEISTWFATTKPLTTTAAAAAAASTALCFIPLRKKFTHRSSSGVVGVEHSPDLGMTLENLLYIFHVNSSWVWVSRAVQDNTSSMHRRLPFLWT